MINYFGDDWEGDCQECKDDDRSNAPTIQRSLGSWLSLLIGLGISLSIMLPVLQVIAYSAGKTI